MSHLPPGQTRILVGLFGVLGLFLGLSAAEDLSQTVPNSSEEQCTAQVLEWHKWIVNAKQKRRQLEVNQEDHNAEVDESMWSGDQVGLLVQHEND